MKKTYVPVTLNEFLNESKSITLKRGYGETKPVVVGTNAPLRNQILSFMSESKRVSKVELKKFIAGLNETSKNPSAAANMWIKRNSKFFVMESKNGQTYFKLSKIGNRLANKLVPQGSLSEQKKFNLIKRLEEMDPKNQIFEDFAEDSEEEELKKGSYDFVDRKKGYARPGINDEMDEACGKTHESGEEDVDDDEDEKMDEATKARVKKLIENIKAKRTEKLNEEDGEEDDDDELTFDDLELDLDADGEEKVEGEEDGDDAEGDGGDDVDVNVDADGAEGDVDVDVDADGDDGDDATIGSGEGEGEEKVEITEFVITVDNAEEAIAELGEAEVTAEQVTDEEGQPIEDQIKVSADDWDALKGWLEEKGVDIEEMFGGEIEVEDELAGDDLEGGDELDLVDPEGGDDELDLVDPEGGVEAPEGGEELDVAPEGEDFDLSLDGAEGELDIEPTDDVEEGITGMEREERAKTPNLVNGKEVTITIK